jgi:hypothetical protein
VVNVKKVAYGLLTLSGTAIIITVVAFFVNVWLSSAFWHLTPTDAFFIEGLFFLIFGVMFLLGSGGINFWTLKASVLAALAGAVCDQDTMGPSEAMRRDRWKPQGFMRLALLFIITGVFMIVIHFITSL